MSSDSIAAVPAGHVISQEDVPMWKWCPRQPLCLLRVCGSVKELDKQFRSVCLVRMSVVGSIAGTVSARYCDWSNCQRRACPESIRGAQGDWRLIKKHGHCSDGLSDRLTGKDRGDRYRGGEGPQRIELDCFGGHRVGAAAAGWPAGWLSHWARGAAILYFELMNQSNYQVGQLLPGWMDLEFVF